MFYTLLTAAVEASTYTITCIPRAFIITCCNCRLFMTSFHVWSIINVFRFCISSPLFNKLCGASKVLKYQVLLPSHMELHTKITRYKHIKYVYCKCRYFRAAKFSRIKPYGAYSRVLIFAHIPVDSI